jgi:hypothetical protein
VNPPASLPAPPSLRPLGLGELLDRAVTLCVKYFVPFALIQLVFAIPFGVARFYASRNFTDLVSAFAGAMQARTAGGAPKPGSDFLSQYATLHAGGGDYGWSFLVVVLSFFFLPLVAGALIDATSATYLGRVPTFGEAYRVGLARWTNMIGVNLLYGLAGGALYVAVLIVSVLVGLALIGLSSAAHTLGLALSVVVGLAFVLLTLGFVILATLALQLSYFACIVERRNAGAAFASGLRRIARGVGLRRALLVGLAYYAALLAIFLVSTAGQFVFLGLLRSAVAGELFVTVVSVATAAFTTAFVTIFYFDLRVREEGLDLELAAEATLGRPLGAS